MTNLNQTRGDTIPTATNISDSFVKLIEGFKY